MVLSSCVIQTNCWQKCEIFCENVHSFKPELNSENEEVDASFIPRLKSAVLGGSTKTVISLTDTYAALLLVHYFKSLSDQSIEVWNLLGVGDKAKYIPVHSPVQNLDISKTSSSLAALILPW